jgi:ATP-binding protein involved in chromosome partitioning
MNMNAKTVLIEWLNQYQSPWLVANWAQDATWIKLVGDKVSIKLPFINDELVQDLNAWIESHALPSEISELEFTVSIEVATLQTALSYTHPKIKNIIAVSSAKGGVGKSTTAVNLALALSKMGAQVGLLDADIYGPSLPIMMGTKGQKPEIVDNKWMKPIVAHGIETHSIGYLIDDQDAAIWRGPMASKALNQLLMETRWSALDYLVIDMPPGTGDIQLTLAQQIPVAGSVVITTPQDLALADAIKGVSMFEKVNIPVIGVVENMSYHICTSCGSKEHIFGLNGAVEMASEFGLPILGQIPLTMIIREDIDMGLPTMLKSEVGELGQLYLTMAKEISGRMFWQGQAKPEEIQFVEVK